MKNLSELTLADLKAMKPRPEVWAFAKACGGDLQKFWDTCPNGDWLLWLLRQTGNLSEPNARKIGLAYAHKVLPIFEQNVPNDNRPRRCLQAVENYLEKPTRANQNAMFVAANAAHTAGATYAAAASAYYAACYPSGSASADYAVHFATAATAVIATDNSFCSTADVGARKKFDKWGANQVRSLLKLPAQKSKPPKARPQP